MKTWKTWILRLVFFVLWHIKHLQNDLINLSFIQFARWVIIPRNRFPYLGGRPAAAKPSSYDYLLFFSNFNGTWNQYIDAFSAVLSERPEPHLALERKVPRLGPRHAASRSTSRRVQFDTDYYYTAYPQATANDVKSAHIVQQALNTLSSKAESLTPEQFQQAYLQFVLTVQAHLGATGEAPPVF